MSIVDEEENIKVVVRIRPLNEEELENGEKSVVHSTGDLNNEVQVRLSSLDAHNYRCNRVFPSSQKSQKDFFNQCGLTNLLDSAIGGYRACCFAFGQTGEYNDLNRGTDVNRLCIADQIGNKV